MLLLLPGAWATSGGIVILGGGGAGGPGSDTTAIHVDVASEIFGITDKATPLGADRFVLESAADAEAKRSALISSLTTQLESRSSAVSANTAALGIAPLYRMLTPGDTLTISSVDIAMVGRIFLITSIDASVGTPITVDTEGGEPINTGTDALLTFPNDTIELRTTGTALESLNNDTPSLKSRLKDAATFKDVFKIEDFPPQIVADDGVMRNPLVLGNTYVVHVPLLLPRILVPTNPTAGTVFTEISAASQNVALFIDGPSETGGDADTGHFWGRDIGNFRIDNALLLDVGNSGTGLSTVLFDMVGQGPDISVANPQGVLFLNKTGLSRFLDFGRLVDVALSAISSGWGFNERGLVLRSVEPSFGHLFGPFLQLQVAISMTTPMLSFQGAQTTISTSNGILRLLPGDSSYLIDSLADGTYEFLGLTYAGPTTAGNFFRPDISVSITAFASGDIAFASVTDSSVNPGVDSTIRFSTKQKFTRGDLILIKGDTGTTYDGNHPIVRVSTDQMGFDVNVTFIATDTGDVQITEVTAVGHGLSRGETFTISGTSNYDVTDEVLSRIDDDTFSIPVEFNGDDATGTVSSTSKTQKSVGVDVLACGAQPNSKILAFAKMNGNATATVIASPSTFQAMDVSGLSNINGVTERLTLTDATAGVYTYDGEKPISARVTAIPSATKSGSTQDYRFAVSVNGAIPTFEDVTSVAAGTTGSDFITSGVHSYVLGDIAVHTGFADATYNGTFTITAIVSTTRYEIAAISFNATGTGETSVPFDPMEVKTSKVQAGVTNFAPVVQGDTIQVMVAGDGHSDNITFTDYTLELMG